MCIRDSLSSLQPGVNIVVYSDGSTKKIIR